MEIKDQFVSYEIALKLKELGFNEKCIAYYTADKNQLTLVQGYNSLMFADYVHLSNTVKSVPAPLWQQVIDWFRIKYSIHIHINDSFLVSTNSPQYKDMIYYYDYTVGCKSNTKFGDFEADYNKIREVTVLKAIKMIERWKY